MQFGFKKNIGCANALFVFTEVVKYYLDNHSSVFGAALDVKKAFDRVSHYKLFTALIKRHVPVWIITILINWYSKLFVTVRWRNMHSYSYKVLSGVRQGGPLSPALFNVFVNDSISKLQDANIGCCIGKHFYGIIMYADDILLLSPTIGGLQRMLDMCTQMFNEKLLEFNVKKSSCFIVGPAALTEIESMTLQGETIGWKSILKYLGITFEFGRRLKVNLTETKRRFYLASNSILNKTRGFDDLIRLYLLESHCLPLLMYALPALNLGKEQVRECNVAWNNMFRHIFGFNRWESVREFMSGIGRIDFKHIFISSYITFVKTGMTSSNAKFRFLVLRHYFCEMNIFMNKHNFKLDVDIDAVGVSGLKELVARGFHVSAVGGMQASGNV